MIIKEGLIIKIVDKNDIDRAIIDKIIAQQDIEIMLEQYKEVIS